MLRDKYNILKLIPAINIALSCSAFILLCIVLSSLRKPYYPDSKKANVQISEQTGARGGAEPVKVLPAASGFNDEIFKRKQLFNFSKRRNKEAKGQEFLLLGVSIGEKNIAMIKDTRENKDYYCKEGDKIGNFNIKLISKNKVILESEGDILVISQ